MPGSRSWNRRETNVTQAGYFTVLRSTGWFSALSRLPGGYRYVVKGPATPDLLVKPEGVGTAAPENDDAAQETAAALQMLTPKTGGLGLLQLAVAALVAAGIIALVLLVIRRDSLGSW